MKSYEELSAEIQQKFSAFEGGDPKDCLIPIGDFYFKAKEQLLNPKPGVSIIWDIMMKIMNGIRPNEFTIFCGPTGAGKTMFLANLASHLSQSGAVTFVAPVETGAEDFIHKMLSITAQREVNTADGVPLSELDGIEKAYEDIFYSQKIIFTPYESRVNHWRIICDLYNAHYKYNATVALIDNLNFMMDVTSAQNQLVEMDKVVHDLVVFTKLVPMHIIMVMHPKKTEGGRVESEFDIKGSSTAVQEASNVILWNRLMENQEVSLADYDSKHLMREMKFCKIRKNGKYTGSRIIFKKDDKCELLHERYLP